MEYYSYCYTVNAKLFAKILYVESSWPVEDHPIMASEFSLMGKTSKNQLSTCHNPSDHIHVPDSPYISRRLHFYFSRIHFSILK